MKEFKFKISEKEYTVSVDSVDENVVNLTVNGKQHTVEMAHQEAISVAKPVVIRPTAAAAAPKSSAGTAGKLLKSPLPGIILDIFVREGESVKSGQKVILLEAMKMENNIDADCDGIIKAIKVNKGDSVSEGDVLLIIE
jgi:biotin carboxyl carrier protein